MSAVRMRFPILALLLVVVVLALCWRGDRVQPLDRYDQRFYLGIAFDLRHHHRFTDGFFFAGGNDRTERPSGMRFTPLYPALLAAAASVSPRTETEKSEFPSWFWKLMRMSGIWARSRRRSSSISKLERSRSSLGP